MIKRTLLKAPIKLGILGCGSFVQRRILPVLKDVNSIQVTCLHKQNLNEAQQLASRFGIPYAVSSRDELIHHPEVEAVFIATPNSCHEEDAIACAQALKPTLCEKPLAPTSDAIIRMQKAFANYSVPLFVGHSMRFKPAIQKAKEIYETGALGNLLHIRAYYTVSIPEDNWRYKKNMSGGVLQDVGIHLVDLIHFISGDIITSIHAIANSSFNHDSNESEHTVVAVGRLADQIFISFECSLHEFHRSGFEVIGSKSRLISTNSLRQTDNNNDSLCHIHEDDSSVYLPLKTTNIYKEELTHFAQVLRGEVEPLIAADVGLVNQRVIETAHASIHKNAISEKKGKNIWN